MQCFLQPWALFLVRFGARVVVCSSGLGFGELLVAAVMGRSQDCTLSNIIGTSVAGKFIAVDVCGDCPRQLGAQAQDACEAVDGWVRSQLAQDLDSVAITVRQESWWRCLMQTLEVTRRFLDGE